VIADIGDVYKMEKLTEELAIKTHYEKLDIAKSNCIFYVCFSLPEKLYENDDELKKLLKEENEE
jgi:tRNA (guanine-N7-)-methyltransferase